MEEDPQALKETNVKDKQNSRAKKREEDPQALKEANVKDVQNWRAKKIEEDPEAFQENESQGRQQRRVNEMEKDPVKYHLKEKLKKQAQRLSNVDSAFKRKKNFQASVRNGSIFVCIGCQQTMYDNQVIELDVDWKEECEEHFSGPITKLIGPMKERTVYRPCHITEEPTVITNDFICYTCKRYLEKNTMAPMNILNNLQFVNIDDHPEMQLSELEQQLIALNILFQKIVLLPKSRMSAMKDRTISVPIETSDVTNTLTRLPRTPSDARLAVVQLKRRLNFPGVHNQQLINIRNVIQALRTFLEMKNPHYQGILEDEDFKRRCLETDPEGYQILFPEESIDLTSLEINSQRTDDGLDFSTLEINSQKVEEDQFAERGNPKEEEDHREINTEESVDEKKEKDEEEDYITNDPVAKNQFNYNRSTCFSHNHPEIDVEENSTDPVQVAPGQGKLPKNMLQDEHFEVKSFPCLFPDGKNGKDEERKVKLPDQYYWQQRILNADRRCGNCPPYVFMAAAHTETKQLNRNINLSFQRGLERVNPNGTSVYTLEDSYMVLDNIKNTPRYWKKAREELYAKLENLGPFTFFYTLSCADIRWPENFTSLLEGHKITYESIEGKEVFYVDGTPLDDFLNAYPSKHEFIRNNLLNATRNFQHRLRMFLKHIMLSKGSPLTLSHFNYRIEFQLRGAPHAHGTLWMDWKRFTALPNEDVKNIIQALNLIKVEGQLSDNHYQSLVKFADLFVSVTLKNPETVSIVKEVNVHHHTARACRKYGTKCRFNFPRFPTYRTIISTPARIVYPEEEVRKEKVQRLSILLDGVKEVLEDEVIMEQVVKYKEKEIQEIVRERSIKWKLQELISEGLYEKKSSIYIPDDLRDCLGSDVDENGLAQINNLKIKENTLESHDAEMKNIVKERIEVLLSFVDPERILCKTLPILDQYEEALSVNKKGYTIHYKRDVDETMVNTYNPEWIVAWNGNIDFQLCLDYFAVITYISDYYCKDDSGTMKMLQEALQDSMNEDLRTRLRKMVSVFVTHRQMGESEAYYRIIPSMHMKDSNVKTVFAQTGFNPSRFLEKINEDDVDKCEKVVEVEGRQGKYQEKPSLYEKYLRRDIQLQPEIFHLSYAQFVKRYQAIGKVDEAFDFSIKKVRKTYDTHGDLQYENHIISNDYEKNDWAYELPAFIKIKNLKPGELPYMRCRSAQVLRYHKFNREKNLHEYYFSELQLYYPHCSSSNSKLNLDKEKNNFEVCEKTFNSSNISKTKGRIMEHLESVEEGLEKAKDLQNTIGDELDPQKEQDKDECEAEGVQDHPDYLQNDPASLESTQEVTSTSTGVFKTVTLDSDDQLKQLSNKLDGDQQLVLSKMINYAMQIKIARESPTQVMPPLLAIQGGAGAGKSLLIKAVSQWFEKILRKAGDDPDKPYILLTAFTGCAAANIDGMTLHSAFNFNFGNEFLSLGDKTRDQKREFCKNLKAVIIDEAFVLKADDFYKFDLRMRELMQNTEQPFGGCAVLLLGDILQLRPVLGRFIFEQPICSDYHLSFTIDPLWRKFEVILLTHNHRQGEDRPYAEILNRIRTGDQTEEDYAVLEGRVKKMDDKDIPPNALFIICTNDKVKRMNESRIEELDGEEPKLHAKVQCGTKDIAKPKLARDGSILNTPLQHKLRLKINAQVMLTYNIDVMDSLSNGTMGKVVGFEFASDDRTVKTVLVQFKNPKAGQERRKQNSALLQQRFPNIPVTPISRIEFRFNLSKNPSSKNDRLTAVQFPLKLAFACTAHKMQGSTVIKPDPLVIDLSSVREAAQAYVMMSRVQSLSQIFILNKLPREKIYPSPVAMQELERIKSIALNEDPSNTLRNTYVISLNVRSLPANYQSFANDKRARAKVIALQEIWCDENHDTNHLQIPGYRMHAVKQGRGKGIATYFQNGFEPTGEFNCTNYQILRVSCQFYDVINVYRSQNANKNEFLRDLGSLARGGKPCFIVGDFNIDILKFPQDPVLVKISSCGFEQIVHGSTHAAGGLLDHVYIKKVPWKPNVSIRFPFYSDHALVFVQKPPE